MRSPRQISQLGFVFAFAVILVAVILVAGPSSLAQDGKQPITSNEYVVVTAPIGYLTGETGTVIDQLPTWTHLLVNKSGKLNFQVTTPTGKRGWIRRELVRPNPLENPTKADLIAAERAVVLMVQSREKSNKEDFQNALRLANEAAKIIEDSIGRDNRLWPWLMATVAHLQYANDDQVGAFKTIDAAQKSLAGLQDQGIAAADLLNVNAFLLGDSGDHAGAADMYRRGLNAAKRVGDDRHSDVRVISMNLASEHYDAGDFEEAARVQKEVYDIGKVILPGGVLEQADATWILGYYLLHLDKDVEGAEYLRDALAVFERNNGKNDESAIAIREMLVDLPPSIQVNLVTKSTPYDTSQGRLRVVSNHAYIRDETDNILRTLARGTTVKFIREVDGKHEVEYRKTKGWVKKGQLVPDPTFAITGLDPALRDKVIQARLLYEESMALFEHDHDFPRALKRMERARDIIEEFGDQATLSSIVKEIAALRFAEGDTNRAAKEINRASELLSGGKLANNLLLRAEIENARGHITSRAGQTTAALTNYTTSLEMLRSRFGDENAGTAALYGNVAQVHLYTGNFDATKQFCERGIVATRAVYGKDVSQMARLYVAYAGALCGLQQYKLAKQYSKRALEIQTELFGPEALETADIHFEYGMILRFSDQLDEAEKQFNRTLEICEFINDPLTNSLEFHARSALVDMFNKANLPLDALTHIGPLLDNLRASKLDTSEMITKYESLAKDLKVAANRPQATAQQMLIVLRDGSIKDGKRVMKTVPLGTRLWSIKEQNGWHSVLVDPETQQRGWINGKTVTSVEAELLLKMSQSPDTLEKQQMVAKLGGILQANQELFAKPDPTREDLVKTLEIVNTAASEVESVGGNNFVMASMRQMLSGFYRQFGEYGEARKQQEAILQTHIDFLGPLHPTTAQDRIALAQTLIAMGDTVAAERQLREATRVMTSTTGKTSQLSSYARASLGNHLINTGAVAEGEALLKSVIKIETDKGRDEQPTMVTPLVSMATLALKSDQPEKAIELLKQAKAIIEVHQDASADVVSDITTQMQIGIAQLQTNQQDRALQNLTQSYQRATLDLGPKHAITSICASFLGYAKSLGNSDRIQARELAQTGLDNMILATGPDHIQIVDPLVSLGAVAYRNGDLQKTLEVLDRARAVTNKYVRENLVEMSAQAQVQFLKENHRRKRDASLALALKHSTDQNVIDNTARWVLNSKGLAVETAAARETLQHFIKTEFSRNRFNKWQTLRSRIATFPLEGANDRVRDARRSDLEELAQQEQQLRSSIATGFAEQVARQQRGMVELKAVQNEIAAGEILIELIRLQPVDLGRILSPDKPQPDRYVAWIIPPAGTAVKFIDLGEADRIDRLVADSQASVLESPSMITDEGPILATKSLRKVMQPLTDALWKPIHESIGNAKKLIISPDANLWLIPWAAIPLQDDRYLVHDFEIQLVNTGRDLVSHNDADAKLNRPVIIADPAFDSDAKEIEDTIRTLELDTQRTRSFTFSGKFNAKRLPGTRAEAEIVEPSLQISNDAAPKTFLGKFAAEAVFKSLERPRTLMMATHGFVLDPDQSDALNPLERCGLLLAGCNETADNLQATGEDGVLMGAEIVSTDLRGTELVVLSACQTGLGTVQDGEGVAGLRQAFQLAGAQSVVATLWEIPDNATVKLIVALFDGFALKMAKPAALRAAQIKRIDQLRKRDGAAHPFFWAAFTVTGQR